MFFGQVILAVPFAVLNVHASLQGYPATLERAASSLGAGPVTTFFRITMPIICLASCRVLYSPSWFRLTSSSSRSFWQVPAKPPCRSDVADDAALHQPDDCRGLFDDHWRHCTVFMASHALRRRATRRRFAERQPSASKATRGKVVHWFEILAAGREAEILMSKEV